MLVVLRAGAGEAAAGDAGGPDEIRTEIGGGRFDQAERLARDLLAEVEETHGPDSLESARVLDLLVEALWRAGRVKEPEAHALAERAVALKERTLGPDHPDLATSLRNHAMLLRESGDLTGARLVYERAIALQERALGPDHPDLAPTVTGLGVVLRRSGDYAGARPLYERALRIREEALGPNDPEVGASLNNLAVLLREMGDYDGARPLYERALTIREQVAGPDDIQLAQMLSNLAVFLRHTGDYPAARRCCERALAIRERALGPDHFLVGDTLDTLGIILATAGDRVDARRAYERALTVREKARGPDHPDVAATTNNLAELLWESGDPAAARPLFERAVSTYEKSLGADHPHVATCVNNLANMLVENGRHAEARPLYERAVAIAEESLGPEHPALAQYLHNLAVSLAELSDPAGAQSRFERALAIRESVLGPSHPIVAESLSGLARLRARSGDPVGALELTLRAERIGREHLRLIARSMAEREALRYAAVRPAGLNLALSLAAAGLLDPASLRRLWDEVVLSRTLVLDEMAARRRAVATNPDRALDRLWTDLSSARQRLANLTVRGPGAEPAERYRALLDSARRDKERAERALADASAALRLEQEREQAGLDQVERSLPRGSALLAYARYRHAIEGSGPGVASYMAFVLRADASPLAVVPLGPADVIEGAIETWKAAASVAPPVFEEDTGAIEAKHESVARRLRRLIWDPSVSHLAAAEHVFVVPDGPLHLVSLYALPAGPGAYLAERSPEIRYLSTERDIVMRTTVEDNRGGLLVLGGPAYDETSAFAQLSRGSGAEASEEQPGHAAGASFERRVRSSCEDFYSMSFDPLPGALREAHEVARVWKKARAGRTGGDAERPQNADGDVLALTGSGATEAAFKAHVRGRAALHLATHGFFLGGSCRSALDSSRGIAKLALDDDKVPRPMSGENPLLLSGLALAGANHRAAAGPDEDDGILTAEEIAAMNLSGVEWVVLSACDTGLGEIKAGEGVFGLRRAFQVAGARTLIMSLWAVEDEPARAWMRALYEARLVKGMDTAESVREASLTVLRDRRERGESTHPFYWAGFVAAGDWR